MQGLTCTVDLAMSPNPVACRQHSEIYSIARSTHSLILAVSQLSACMCLHIVGPLQLASAVNVVVCYE